MISTLVFIVAAWILPRYLDEIGIPKTSARTIVVFIAAYLISWSSGELVDWVQEKIEGPRPITSPSTEVTSEELAKLLKDVK